MEQNEKNFITAKEAHMIAIENKRLFDKYCSDIDSYIKRAANRGEFRDSNFVPKLIKNKLIAHFKELGFKVSVHIIFRNYLTIKW